MNIILLSGGSGKRLWPLSNDIRSKQFIKIFKKEDGTYESMVQRVYRQIKKVDTDATVTIATGKTQVSAIHNQLGEDVGISVEPCRRDTFPAIALATAYLVDVMHVAPSESVVVCPVDPYAKMKEHGQLGKTEMWYVLDAARDAKLIYGLRQDCTKKEMQKALAKGAVMKYLQKVPIHKDDLFFIPAGTIHAIGAGALVAEIQESSNLTYRLYDYDRIGKDGKKRELHIDKALDVADLHGSAEPRQPLRVLKYRPGMASELLIRCKYFEVYRMLINTERRQTVHYRADRMAFRVLLCMDGCGTISYDERTVNFYKGDCVFVPADSEVLTIHGQAQFLDIRG